MRRKIVSFLILFIFVSFGILYFPYPSAAAAGADLHGRIVILDPGHGFDHTNTYEDYDEQVTMLKLALKIKPLLEARGADVYMTRPTEAEIPLPARAAIINRWALNTLKAAKQDELSDPECQNPDILQSDIDEINRLLRIVQSVINDPETNAPVYLNNPFDYTYTREMHPDWREVLKLESDPVIRDRFLVISLHSNATPKPIDESKSGVEIYYASNSMEDSMTYFADYSYEELNIYFGRLLMDRLTGCGLEKRFIKFNNFLILREHNLPCVLVENGYHTNELDRAMLSDDAFLDRLALIYADAVTDYFSKLGSLVKLYYPEPMNDVFG